eukprot:Skav222634  [mRNA]  locus=scaffold10:187684:190948:+ [translate_table: standard]
MVEVSPRPGAKLSRKCQQRVGKRRHFEEEVNATISSLNRMYGAGGAGDDGLDHSCGLAPSAGQLQCLEFIEHAIAELGTPDGLGGSEALEELRVSTGYNDLPSMCPLASFDSELVALPSGGMKPVPLESLWGEGGQHEVEEFYRKRVLGPDDARAQLDACGVQRCYQDPKLNDPATYAGFLKRLLDLNLVEASLQPPKELVGLFFVRKKNNMIRLIMDCRRSNCHFAEPDKVQLATGEAMSRMHLPAGGTIHTASADLQNAFYTMAMPQELRSLFGLRAVKAGLLGLTEVGGHAVSPDTMIHCRVSVIPMGWKWALYFCQRVNERICERCGLLAKDRLRDGVAAPDSGFWHVQYVDNLHVFGTDKAVVEQHFWRAVQGLREAGLTVHEIEIDEGETKVLGWELEKSGTLRPSRRRLWRLRLGLREILRRGRASGQQIERLVGHITFVSLCRRESLAILGECYSFIRQHCDRVVPLWKSVRKELAMWDGVAPLLAVDLTKDISNTIYSVDASEWGLGVVTSEVDNKLFGTLVKHCERWRFRDEEARDARNFVLAEDDRINNTIEGGTLAFDSGCNQNFATCPFEGVARDWKVVGRYRWKRLDSMPVYEALASLYAIKHAVRNSSHFGRRHIILTDSMTAAVSFDKASWDRNVRRKGPERRLPNRQVQVSPMPVQTPLTWDIEKEDGRSTSKKLRRADRRKDSLKKDPARTLRNCSVGPVTRNKYQKLWEQLVAWSKGKITTTMNRSRLDALTAEYVEHLYRGGEDLSAGSYLVAAVAFKVPQCKGVNGLPVTQQALRGWRKECPPRSRMPLPFEVVCLLAEHAVQQGMVEIGLLLLLVFMLYLRPGEAFRLRVQDIVMPVKRAGKMYKHYTILLHPTEVGIPSKTSQWDEMLSLDLAYQSFLGPAMVSVLKLKSRPKEQLAFSVTLDVMNQFMKDAWEPLGLKSLGPPHMYRLRHGGASYEAAMQLRPLAAIQLRGRWQTIKSVKNYEKGSRLPQLFASLNKPVQRRALTARENVHRLFHALP